MIRSEFEVRPHLCDPAPTWACKTLTSREHTGPLHLSRGEEQEQCPVSPLICWWKSLIWSTLKGKSQGIAILLDSLNKLCDFKTWFMRRKLTNFVQLLWHFLNHLCLLLLLFGVKYKEFRCFFNVKSVNSSCLKFIMSSSVSKEFLTSQQLVYSLFHLINHLHQMLQIQFISTASCGLWKKS